MTLERKAWVTIILNSFNLQNIEKQNYEYHEKVLPQVFNLNDHFIGLHTEIHGGLTDFFKIVYFKI